MLSYDGSIYIYMVIQNCIISYCFYKAVNYTFLALSVLGKIAKKGHNVEIYDPDIIVHTRIQDQKGPAILN